MSGIWTNNAGCLQIVLFPKVGSQMVRAAGILKHLWRGASQAMVRQRLMVAVSIEAASGRFGTK